MLRVVHAALSYSALHVREEKQKNGAPFKRSRANIHRKKVDS
jgi:hypothetical protein